MINIDPVRLLKISCYYEGARFGDFPYFFSLLNDSGQLNIEKFSEAPWRKRLIEQELQQLQTASQSEKIQLSISSFYAKGGPEKRFEQLREIASNFLGIHSLPPLLLVEELPPPFSDKNWNAMFVDESDSRKLGIDKGIYFVKKFLTHCFFEYVVAHEIVHWFISERSASYFPNTSINEEGLCDILGLVFLLKAGFLPNKAIANLVIYNRSMAPSDILWHHYWKASQRVLRFASKTGLSELVRIVNSGRDAVTDFDRIIVTNKAASLEPELLDVMALVAEANSVTTLAIDDYIVLETTINNKVHNSISIGSISEISGVGSIQVKNSLQTLDALGLVVNADKDVYQIHNVIPSHIRFAM